MDNISDICANCGKGEESSDSLKVCTACKMVKYCSRECQIAHRPQHKKACKKRAAELYDEKLFKQPPPREDCPICMIRLPVLDTGRRYMSCCGKVICSGCNHAPVYDNEGNVVAGTCPFCRTPNPVTNEEVIKRVKKRAEAEDPHAIHMVGMFYSEGKYDFPQNYAKALELWHRAGELEYAASYFFIGFAYQYGKGVEVDEKKAKYYYELAAMEGDANARFVIGCKEANAGNYDRALNHFMIAAKGGGKLSNGVSDSLETMRKMVTNGHATKDDYKKALESYQVYLDEIRSDQRDEAAAADENYKYY